MGEGNTKVRTRLSAIVSATITVALLSLNQLQPATDSNSVAAVATGTECTA
jgi:hypothetical protein